MTDKELFRMAVEASENAYAPFSNFHVGAALLTEDGAKSGLTEAGVTELFQFIRIDWNSGET